MAVLDPEYWLQRWREGRTGWHHDDVMPLLEQHWPSLDVPRGARVLVPLCGKSLDMLWLASRGLRVLGVEVSPLAVKAFLEENRLQAQAEATNSGAHYRVANVPADGEIEIINGDLFDVQTETVSSCTAFYDRAATIALPVAARERMARDVYAKLPAKSRGLLIVLDYPSHEMDGPPFSVDYAEVHRLFAADWEINQLERRDILASQPHFATQGVTALHTAVYCLTKRAA